MAYVFKHGDRPLDDYTVQRAVGRGGFGEVYFAVSDGGREVALKYLHQNPQTELRGVSHCMNLKSPHLVTVFDVKQNADGEYFIIMEYSSGPSLRDILIAEPNGIGPQKAAFFLREIAKGLGYLHDRGIVHRDLKPGNIFYDEGYVKIGDYGLSKFIAVSRHSAQTASIGTVHYMAPEVGSGNYHRGIDLYALGVMLYEMLLGKVPFEGGSMGEVLMKHLTQQPEVAGLPEPFGKIIRKALEKDPKDRYQTVYEMVDDLLEVEDMKTSLAGFNPTSLDGIERHDAPWAGDSPVPSPNPAPVPVEGRARAPINLDVGDLPPTLAKRIRATSQKVETRVRKLDAKFGRKRPLDKDQPTGTAPAHLAQRSPASWEREHFFKRIGLVLAMAIGLGVLVGLIVNRRDDGMAGAIFLTLGMSGGLALGCRFLASFSEHGHHPRWIERVSFAAPVAGMTILGSAIFSEAVRDSAWGTWAGLVAAGMFVSWRNRIERGSRGELSLGRAAWAGLFALIVASIATAGNESALAMASGVTAATSLVIQAAAWLFPLEAWMTATPGALPSPTENISEAHKDRRQPFLSRLSRSYLEPESADATDNGNENDRPIGDTSEATVEDNFLNAAELPPEDPRPRRWKITRVLGAMTGFFFLVAAVAFTGLFMDDSVRYNFSTVDGGAFTHIATTRSLYPEERIALVSLVVASLGLMLVGFRKARRFRSGGFYRDSLRPVLMTFALTGVALALGAKAIGYASGPPPHVARAVLVGSLLLLAFLFIVRGSKYSLSSPTASGDA